VFHRVGGPAAAIRFARQKRATAFDPEVADALLRLADSDAFWAELQQESMWIIVQAMEPASEYQVLAEDRLEQVALAFADFADLKYPHALGHSRRVAELAERFAPRDCCTTLGW
jgi:HD-GYP domain-containing protein (c-di-GMP phosphodiesterase class II)